MNQNKNSYTLGNFNGSLMYVFKQYVTQRGSEFDEL